MSHACQRPERCVPGEHAWHDEGRTCLKGPNEEVRFYGFDWKSCFCALYDEESVRSCRNQDMCDERLMVPCAIARLFFRHSRSSASSPQVFLQVEMFSEMDKPLKFV